jgi:MFS family permease
LRFALVKILILSNRAPDMDEKQASTPPRAEATGPGDAAAPWYKGVTPYQWLILAIASAGWVFDVYEGQIFNITRNQLLADILKGAGGQGAIKGYGDVFLGIFLLGGTAGGLLFGSMADRWGRKPTMAVTILMYSLCSGLTYFAQSWQQVAALRFLVAMGVGGEWAVAASLVAEVFPARARAHASGIFHATSVLGTWTATLAGLAVGANWRYAYLVGVIPALLVAWVMASVNEPESWKRAGAKVQSQGGQMGSFRDLLTDPRWVQRALLGMLLAAVGLGTFWAVTVAGQDLAKEMLVRTGAPAASVMKRAQFAYGFVETLGGGLGLLAFGPLCVRLGRKRAFTWMMIGAFVIVPITCYVPQTYGQLLCLLPFFGFLTLGMHAGFAIYFPELFPTPLRATGAGFCFNVGRTLAATMLFFSGWLKARPGMELRAAISLLGFLFLLGLIVIRFLPETKDQPLPE